MPKRTNDFQRLITLIEHMIEPEDATVTESKELLDKITNSLREVDIVIEASHGTHTVITGIECVSGRRPATVEWVERMYGKHATLPTDKLILVSKAGFTEDAVKKADWFKMSAFSLKKAETIDWLSIVRQIAGINIRTFIKPKALEVAVNYDGESDEPYEEYLDFDSTLLTDSTGHTITTLLNFVEDFLSQPALIEQLKQGALENIETLVLLRLPIADGIFLMDATGKKRKPISIDIHAKCFKGNSKAMLTHGSYGKVDIAYSEFSILDTEYQIALVQQPNQIPALTFSPKVK